MQWRLRPIPVSPSPCAPSDPRCPLNPMPLSRPLNPYIYVKPKPVGEVCAFSRVNSPICAAVPNERAADARDAVEQTQVFTLIPLCVHTKITTVGCPCFCSCRSGSRSAITCFSGRLTSTEQRPGSCPATRRPSHDSGISKHNIARSRTDLRRR